MEFSSPSGDVYISSEIVYEGPDNIFMLGVTRPSIFIPIALWIERKVSEAQHIQRGVQPIPMRH